jgi:predicted nucleotidyltransferase
MQNTIELLRRFAENGMEFVIVGGFAAVVHGVSIVTDDVDLCISFDRSNMERMLAALNDLHPAHRLIGKSRPLVEEADTLASFRNLYLTTDLGTIDLLSQIADVGGYEEVSRRSIEALLFGFRCRVLDLDALIDAKKAMGRPKDKQSVLELEAIRERRASGETP